MHFLCKKLYMQVLVLTNDELKEELLACPISDTIHFTYSDSFADHFSGSVDACIDLLFENTPQRIQWLNQLQAPLVIINSVITPLNDIQKNYVRINGWNTFLKRPVMEAAATSETLKTKAEELFINLGRKTEWVPDITGFITPRVVASIINEAFFALEENVSTEEEIDTAMKLGTNYPYGPFEWSKKIGASNIYSLLSALSKKQIRYQPSTLLKQTALAL